MGYFNALNYSLGDEDTRIEYALLPQHRHHVLTIAGSGGRALPLLAKAPRRLTCVDIQPMQLHLTRMRFAALATWNVTTYGAFLGYPPHPMDPEQRKEHFHQLDLPDDTAQALEAVFSKHAWGPIIYMGRFEQTLITLSKIVGLVCGKRARAIFDVSDPDAQRRYFQQQFPRRAWNLVMLLLGNSTVLNSLLYKGDFPKKNIPRSAFAIYRDIFTRLLSAQPARASFFLQLVFFGRMPYVEGNPIECDPDVYQKAQAALTHTEVDYVLGDVLETADPSVDFVSLSDVPSFLKGDLEDTFMQKLSDKTAPEALVVYRGHLRLPNPNTRGFEDLKEQHAALLDSERTQLWHIYPFRKMPVGSEVTP